MTVLLLKLHASHSVVARIVLARMVDLNKQKSLFFMELFLYLIFLDLDKIDVYRDKTFLSSLPRGKFWKGGRREGLREEVREKGGLRANNGRLECGFHW